MEYLKRPNLPEKAVRLVVADGRIPHCIEEKFKYMGIKVIKTRPYPNIQKAISFHPDIFLTHVGGNKIVYAPKTDGACLAELDKCGFDLVKGETELQRDYPSDIAYNVAVVGSFYFHNLKYTDPVLRSELEKKGLQPVNVAQGYTKCSISVVDENTIITEDKGIARAAESKGIRVLLLQAGQNIALPGIGQGFTGGSSGMLDKSLWAVAGNAGKLVSYQIIEEFLNRKGIGILSLSEEQVLDVGSILPLGY